MKFKLNIVPGCEETIEATVQMRSSLTDRIESLVLRYAGEDQLHAYTEDDMLLLRYGDIECIRVMDGKTWASDKNGKDYRVKMRLSELEERLPQCFIRINKSALANEQHLIRFAAAFSGAVDAVFRSGRKEYVSRRCYAQIKRRYTEK